MNELRIVLDDEMDDVLLLVDEFNWAVAGFSNPDTGWVWLEKPFLLEYGDWRPVSEKRILEITSGVMPDFSQRPKDL